MIVPRKVILQQSGERAPLVKKIKTVIKFSGKKAADLNLHAFYKEREGNLFGHIYAENKGNLYHPPCIQLDVDTDGDWNAPRISVNTLTHVELIVIAVKVKQKFGFFSLGENFAEYDGKLTLETGQRKPIEVPLIAEQVGKWCIIAKIDNSDSANPQVININKVQKSEPSLGDFVYVS